MIRASTTPSILTISLRIIEATRCAIFWSLAVTRMLIGVDLPSFIAERTMPPASKANSRSLNSDLPATPWRSSATYSWADFFRSAVS